MFCAKCGSRLPDGNRYCNSCGATVKAPPAPPQAPAPVFSPPSSCAAQPQPAFAATGQPAASGPVPPDMHWALVLVLAWITFGIFGLVWAFRQAGFVMKIDPASKAKTLFMVCLACMAGQFVLLLVGILSGSAEMMVLALVVVAVLQLGVAVACLLGVFGMRNSLLSYYNTVEPAGLQLSALMTFFFNFLYFQYHFSRIAAWKRTGRLE